MPCVYLPGPAPAVTVANKKISKTSALRLKMSLELVQIESSKFVLPFRHKYNYKIQIIIFFSWH